MANVCGIAKKSSDAMIYHRLTPLLSSHVKKYAYAAASSTYCVSEYRNASGQAAYCSANLEENSHKQRVYNGKMIGKRCISECLLYGAK